VPLYFVDFAFNIVWIFFAVVEKFLPKVYTLRGLRLFNFRLFDRSEEYAAWCYWGRSEANWTDAVYTLIGVMHCHQWCSVNCKSQVPLHKGQSHSRSVASPLKLQKPGLLVR